METEEKTPILNIAWTRYAHFDAAANERTGGYTRLRRWIAILGVITTLFAVFAANYPKEWPATLGVAIKIVLIAIPIISSIVAAFTNKFFSGGDWLVARA